MYCTFGKLFDQLRNYQLLKDSAAWVEWISRVVGSLVSRSVLLKIATANTKKSFIVEVLALLGCCAILVTVDYRRFGTTHRSPRLKDQAVTTYYLTLAGGTSTFS